MVRYLILILLFCTSSSCIKNNTEYGDVHNRDDYHIDTFDYALKRAWNDHDTAMMRHLLLSIDTLDDYGFYSNLALVSNITNFYYGNADPTQTGYWQQSTKERTIRRNNVTKVYKLYAFSCLYMKSIDQNLILSLQDKYWNEEHPFSVEELQQIKLAIDSLCVKNK